MSLEKTVKQFGLVCIGVFGLSGAATAGEYVLTYSETELATHDGVKDVHSRIVAAARDYCPTYSRVRSLAEVRDCIDDVVDDLVDKVNHPKMTSYHTGEAVRVIADGVDHSNRDRS
ncbi:MAG: UrcA family protein [Pseudomonadota bacterium]